MRQKIFASPDLALAGVLADGITVMSGGFGLSGNPESLIDVVRRSGVKRLRSFRTMPGPTASGCGRCSTTARWPR